MPEQMLSPRPRRPWPDDAEDLFDPLPAPPPLPAGGPIGNAAAIDKRASAAPRDLPRRGALAAAKQRRSIFRWKRHVGGSALTWAALGFACGIVFWHFIGFWSFVSEIVLPAPSLNRQEALVIPGLPEAKAAPHLPLRIARPRPTKQPLSVLGDAKAAKSGEQLSLGH